MTKLMLAAGAAALAIVSPAMAGPKGNGGEQKHENHGGGDRGHGGGHGNKGERSDRGDRGERQQARGNDQGMKSMRGAKAEWKERRDRDDRAMAWSRDDARERMDDRDDDARRFGARALGATGWRDGCPPGLAKKNNGCLPPGQYDKIVGTALPASYAQAALSGPFAQWYRDEDGTIFRQGDGVVYRVDKATGNILGVIPTSIDDYGYYPLGMTYPASYNSYNVPMQYQGFYPSDADLAYRYANGAIYGVDPQTSAVRSIVALLAGDLAVGQPLPSSYSVYNVPMAYRSQYYDTPDAMYRYNDGYIYRVDPTTQLVTSVVSALLS